MTKHKSFISNLIGWSYECPDCGIFSTADESTRPRQFDQCECGKCGVDWGDGYYRRIIGRPITHKPDGVEHE